MPSDTHDANSTGRTTPDPAADRWRWASLVSMGALIATVTAWRWPPTRSFADLIVAGMLCLPALVPLIGIAKANRYTFKWATLCVMPYFVVGLTESVANPTQRAWAGTVLCLSLLWFVALVAFLRVTRNWESVPR